MGALVDLFPIQFLAQSEIAKSTNTCRYLSNMFELDNIKVDSPTILDALASLTQTNQRIAKATCCKVAQRMVQEGQGVL